MPQFSVVGQGAFSALQVDMGQSESVKAESDAMVSRSATVCLDARLDGGIFGALGRLFLTGESLYFQTLSTQHVGGTVLFAPKSPGTIQIIYLGENDVWCFRQGAFLAANRTVSIESTRQRSLSRAFLSGHGFFVLTCRGPGELAVNATGSIVSYVLEPGQELIVDNDHVLGWTEGMQYEIKMQGRTMFASAASGEGLGCFFYWSRLGSCTNPFPERTRFTPQNTKAITSHSRARSIMDNMLLEYIWYCVYFCGYYPAKSL